VLSVWSYPVWVSCQNFPAIREWSRVCSEIQHIWATGGRLAQKEFNSLGPEFPKECSREKNSGYRELDRPSRQEVVTIDFFSKHEAFKVAVTNRNWKLGLDEAWMNYWSALFPDGTDWRSDLEKAIRARLYFPGETSGFLSDGKPDLPPPAWASDLELSFQSNKVEVKFLDTDFGNFPLFTDHLLQVLGNWKVKNPLERTNRAPSVSDRESFACRDFLNAAVRDCGNIIQSRLFQMIKETEQPKFEVYCRPHADVFAEQWKLPVSGLLDISSICIATNELRDRLRLPKCSHVQIKLRTDPTSRAGPRGSFQKEDAKLVEKMKSLIDRGEVNSVRKAANAVLKDAQRRNESTDDSVVKRLQIGFSAKYPNYVNQLGQFSPLPSK
jgi:hypothetical protein